MKQPIRVIAFAMHVSILIYGYILLTLSRSNGWVASWTVSEDRKLALYVIAGAASFTAVLSVIAPRVIKLKGLDSPGLFFDFSTVAPPVNTLTIIRMALAEAVAIYGFVLAFMNQSMSWFYPFAAVGLFLQVLVGPFGRYLRGR